MERKKNKTDALKQLFIALNAEIKTGNEKFKKTPKAPYKNFFWPTIPTRKH